MVATEMEACPAVGRVLARPSTSLAPRILILVGGFAGVNAALELARRCAGVLPVHITLVSDQNFFLFTPMLVLALGASPNVAQVPATAEHALTFKGVGEAIQIRNRVIDQFEAAALTDDPWLRRRLLTFVVVRVGHAGTELMAALEELTRGILLRHYPTIPPDNIRLVLVGSAVIPQTATNLAAYTREQLLKRGIELETARAAKVSADGLTLQDGRLKANEVFEVEGARGVYALRDNAHQIDPHTGNPYVATAQVAIRQARALAGVIEAELTGREKQPFRFKLPRLASRLRVVLDRTVELFFERDVSEVVVHDGQGQGD